MDDMLKEIGPGTPENEGKKALNILLVEDETSIVPFIKLVLDGHNITSFESAEEALNALRKAKEAGTSFDWVITDRGLAGNMDGFGLADLIKNEKLGNPFVTMLTGSAAAIRAENPAEKLQERGIHQLMGKPFRPNELTDSVNAAREFKTQFQNPQI